MPLWVLILANIAASVGVLYLMTKRWKASKPGGKVEPRLVRTKVHAQRCKACKKDLYHYPTQYFCVQEGDTYYHPQCYPSMVFVVFYDTFAWVAGTCTYGCVGQGSTAENAISSLQRVLVGDAVLARNAGKIPYLADEYIKFPTDPFLLAGTEEEYVPEGSSDRTKKYRGWVKLLNIKDYYLN